MPLQTSLEAYRSIQPNIAFRQKQVYEALKKMGEATSTMLSQYLMLPINCIVPRVFELRQAGYVSFAYISVCPITHHTATFWHCTQKKINY